MSLRLGGEEEGGVAAEVGPEDEDDEALLRTAEESWSLGMKMTRMLRE